MRYHGRVIWSSNVANTDYTWSLANGYVIDAEDSTSLGKWANHYVSGVFYCNCILVNVKGEAWFKATKDIPAGTELYWNYGKQYWQGRPYKLKKSTLKPLKDKILWRDCDDEEMEFLNDKLK